MSKSRGFPPLDLKDFRWKWPEPKPGPCGLGAVTKQHVRLWGSWPSLPKISQLKSDSRHLILIWTWRKGVLLISLRHDLRRNPQRPWSELKQNETRPLRIILFPAKRFSRSFMSLLFCSSTSCQRRPSRRAIFLFAPSLRESMDQIHELAGKIG